MVRTPLYACLLLAAAWAALSCTSCMRPQAASEVALEPPPTAAPPPEFADISVLSLGQRVPVIMYHDIIEERNRDSQWFDCTAAEFEDQMKTIQQDGSVPISLDELYKHLTTGSRIPDKAIVLTFDDNYQGFFDRALPVLERYNFPATMFVHTAFVGNKSGLHPKMDWPTLETLAHNPLITIESHTVTHPDDITLLGSDQQRHELEDSKQELESKLGVKIDYLAYPDGKNDPMTQDLARQAGYKMAFSIDNMLAEESPNILCVGRYVHTRLQKALQARDDALRGGVLGIFQGDLRPAPVEFKDELFDGAKLALVYGGTPSTMLSDTREGVLDFCRRANAVAGINGGFFAMAAIKSTDNRMVGPLRASDQSGFVPDLEKERWAKLHNRPVILWGPTSIAIVPYQPNIMISDEGFKALVPNYTDLFLAGVWLVHNGLPCSREQLDTFGSKDIEDPRRRAFLGVTSDGRFVIGASHGSISSEKLASAAAAAGVQEAVLLDSGFSTSLVYDGEVKVSGHSTATIPSRPVPHAVVIRGEIAADAATKPQ